MSTAEKSLHEFLTDDYELELKDVESFVVDSKERAVWAMRIIAEHTKAIDENNDIANKEIMRIEGWREAANKPHQDSIKYFTELLEGYHRKLYEETDGKTKTVKLPHGELKIRVQEPTFTRDNEGLINFCKDNGLDFVEITESLVWSNLKKAIDITDDGTVYLTETGEPLPKELIVAEKREPKFFVKVVE